MYTAVLKLNMTPVCRPSNWWNQGHGYVNSGFLLGCVDYHPPIGKQVPLSAVSGLTVKTARVNWLQANAANLEENVVYEIPWQTDCGPASPPGLAGSYKWYRQQFHAVRLADPARRSPECWGGGGAEPSRPLTRVAVHIRRGDDPKRGFPVHTYVRILEELFNGKISGVSAIPNKTHIMVIAETSWDDPEFLAFDKFRLASRVDFRFGAECVKVQRLQNTSHCLELLVSDMDCMTTSDVLLGSHGGFSAALWVLQQTGKSLAMQVDSQWTGSDNVIDIPSFARDRSKIRFQTSTDMPDQIDVFIRS